MLVEVVRSGADRTDRPDRARTARIGYAPVLTADSVPGGVGTLGSADSPVEGSDRLDPRRCLVEDLRDVGAVGLHDPDRAGALQIWIAAVAHALRICDPRAVWRERRARQRCAPRHLDERGDVAAIGAHPDDLVLGCPAYREDRARIGRPRGGEVLVAALLRDVLYR